MTVEFTPTSEGLDVHGENMGPAEAYLLMESLAEKLQGVMHRSTQETHVLQWEIPVIKDWALPEHLRHTEKD